MDPQPASDKISEDTLKIVHIPPHLTRSQREVLLKKFGAIKVRTIHKSAKYSITFAKFPSKQAADHAFLRLHQLEVRGRRLSVEYARTSMLPDFSEGDDGGNEVHVDNCVEEPPEKQHFQAFLKRLNGWGFSQTLTQPPHPNIRYKYPLPTRKTLLRIAIQLVKEPIFYQQVLHLMNKMNLPPPFDELENEFPVLKEIYDLSKIKDIFGGAFVDDEEKPADEQSDEDEESELETDEDVKLKPKEVIPAKRKRPLPKKQLKISKVVNPLKQVVGSSSGPAQKMVKLEDVFESIQRGENKPLKIALKTDLTERLDSHRKTDSSSQVDTGFGLIYPTKKSEESTSNEEKGEEENLEFITATRLAANRISINDQRVLPVFKNYHPGIPSCRLYIKNLAKQVEIKDLHFIYKKYVSTDAESPSSYNVRLMQEGRMKGQAFITLENVEQAQIALEETNGYILKDKPMVVQFAKIGNKPQAD